MSLYIKTDTETASVPVFLQILSDVPGGVMFQDDRIPSDVTEIKAGTPIFESASTTGLWDFVKTGKSNSTQSAATSIQLTPGTHLFKTGEFLMKAAGATAATITSITHTSATTDTIVTSVAVGALATATVLVQAAAAALGATTCDEKFDPTGLLRNTIKVREDDYTTLYNVSAGVVIRGTVDETALNTEKIYLTTAQKTSLTSRIYFK
jgi:hypothetical protein